MKITLYFNAQVKSAAGVDELEVELKKDARFNDLISHIRSLSVNKLNDILFTSNLQLSHYLLFVQNFNKQIRPEENVLLNDGDIISIISPISGG